MRIIFLLLSILAISNHCFAQEPEDIEGNNKPNNRDLPGRFPEKQYLGMWCYIDITQNDIDAGKTHFTIPVPPEGIAPGANPIGPGMPHFANHLGNTIDIVWTDLPDLLLELHGYTNPDDAVISIPVFKWVKHDGTYTTNLFEANMQDVCYYFCTIRY